MFQFFYPSEYVNSAYEIDYEAFHEAGYRAVIFDIDNTLVPHGAPSDERSRALIARLRALGMQVFLLSNNKEERVRKFDDGQQIPFIHKAGKPSRKNYRKAMEYMGTNCSDTLFVGDQLFTDVWGAKRTGMYHILVKPMNPKEEIQIVLKRKLEWIVLREYLKKTGNENAGTAKNDKKRGKKRKK